jgi:hypothetical protein
MAKRRPDHRHHGTRWFFRPGAPLTPEGLQRLARLAAVRRHITLHAASTQSYTSISEVIEKVDEPLPVCRRANRTNVNAPGATSLFARHVATLALRPATATANTGIKSFSMISTLISRAVRRPTSTTSRPVVG